MAKKVTTNHFWNIVCFIALALFAIRTFLGFFNLGNWFAMFENITNIIIGVVILISAWNAVASAKKGWKIAYWIFVAIVAVSMILPFFINFFK